MQQPSLKFCPVGIQTFSELINKGYIYIDKTAYIYRMANSASKYYFLSRPRRFGKSLLTSTLHSYFAGQHKLFKGLAVEQLETEWTEYPVLHFDMSRGKHMDTERLERYLNFQIQEQESVYDIHSDIVDVNNRLDNLIRQIFQKTGRQVVVLVDEYDAPLLDVVHEEVNLPALRNVMRNFYSPLKACDPYLRFVFLTGITKFSQLSIFSELNNIKNISMDEAYAEICGITEKEIIEQMPEYIARLAAKQGITPQEALVRLKNRYDGYHFTWPSSDIYNPFSLMNAFADGKINDYWFGSGTPTYLIEMLRKFQTLPSQIGNVQALAADFDVPTENIENIIPLLYQSGYITIKNHDEMSDLYTLDIPNQEIRIGLMHSLLPNYLNKYTQQGRTTMAQMSTAIRQGNMDAALQLLQKFLLTVPYCDNTNYEGHYQQMLYIIFSLLGHYVDVEVRTPRGRVDMVLRTQSTLYVIELKLNKDAETAMKQITLKDYPSRFALCGLPIAKVAITFDSERHTLGGLGD